MTSDLARYELAACLLARRNVSVVVDGSAARPWADARSIHVIEAPPAEIRQQVLSAASLIGAGVFDDLRWTTSRHRTRERYLGFEAGRARAIVLARYPGLAPEGVEDHDVVDSAEDALRRARSTTAAPELEWWWGELRPAPAKVSSAAAALHEVSVLATPAPPPPPPDGERQSLGVIERLLEQVGRARRRGGGARSAATGAKADAFARSAGGPATATAAGWARTATDLIATESEREPGVHAYPEWDHRLGRYRPRWCTVRELAPFHAAGPPVHSIDLRPTLSHLGLSLSRVSRQPHGDDLDLDRCIEANIDLQIGVEPHPTWHVARLRRRRDLAVGILLDVSDSTLDRAPDGRRIHDHQAETASSLSKAIAELGGTAAVHAFRSHGRHDIEMIRCQWFGRNPADDLAGALRGLEPGARTRMGAAIRHSAETLRRHAGASLRMMIVITDGFAYDDGYDAAHGREDARRALLEARRTGIACLCLSVGSPLAPKELAEVFGTTAHAHAEDLPRLSTHLRQVTTSAVADAERVRRRHTKDRLHG